MKIEHVGLNVPDPAAQADWLREHLGFSIKRSAEGIVVGRFVADGPGSVMLELYRNPSAAIPDYAAMNPLVLHIALACPDLAGTVERLTAAGAKLVSKPMTNADGDEIAMLRDPWGLVLQLCRRAEPMV